MKMTAVMVWSGVSLLLLSCSSGASGALDDQPVTAVPAPQNPPPGMAAAMPQAGTGAIAPTPPAPGPMQGGAMEVDAVNPGAPSQMEPEPVPPTGGPPEPSAPPAGGDGVPRIPEPPADCPSFMSGSMTIGGLPTEIEAGTPGPTMGALLFSFHGTGGRGRLASVPASVRAEITSEGGIILAPTGNMGGGDRMDIAPPTGAWFLEDMEYTDLVVACAVRDHNIDPNRIYATGCSAGGLMAGTLGLMRSEYMAAVAPNSGGINWQGSRRLSDASHGPAAFTMHGGTTDNVIVSFQDTSVWFHEQNRSAMNSPFMLDCNHMIGHCGAPSQLHEMAWEFMKAHPYDVGASPWASSPPADLPDYCVVVE